MTTTVHIRRPGQPGRTLLDGATGLTGGEELNDVARGQLTIDPSDRRLLADPTLLDDGNVVDVTRGGKRWGWFIDGEGPSERIVEGRPTPGRLIPAGPTLLAYLSEAEVRPFGGLGPDALDYRPFDWTGNDFDASAWITTPWSGGTLTDPEFTAWRVPTGDWPAPDAEWVWGAAPSANGNGGTGHPPGRMLMHRTLEPDPRGYTGPARLFIAVDDRHITHFDGRPVAAGDTWREYQVVDIELADRPQVLAVDATNGPLSNKTNNPGGIIYAILQVTADGDLGDILYQSQSGTPDLPGADRWLPYPSSTPGFTWGTIWKTLLTEAQARGTLPGLDHDSIDADTDSDDVAWQGIVAYTWRVGTKLLDVFRDFTDWGGSGNIDPDLQLQLTQSAGVDRTTGPAPVVLREGRDVVGSIYTGTGPRANALSIRTEDGWDERTDDDAIAASRRRESSLEVGGAITANDINAPVDRLLDRDGRSRRQATITVVDGHWTFGVDYDLGDVVLAADRSGTLTPHRIIGFHPSGDPDGALRWTLTCVEGADRPAQRLLTDPERIAAGISRAFDRSLQGSTRLATPTGRSERSRASSMSGSGAVANQPQLLLQHADGYEVGTGWHPVVWDDFYEGDRVGYEPQGDGATRVTVSGVHLLRVTLTWDTFKNGGKVRIVVNGERRWGPDLDPQWSSDRGEQFAASVSLFLMEGDLLSVEVNHDDAATQVADLRLHLSLPDPEGASGVPSRRTADDILSDYGAVWWFRLDVEQQAGAITEVLNDGDLTLGAATAGSVDNTHRNGDTVFGVTGPFESSQGIQLNPDLEFMPLGSGNTRNGARFSFNPSSASSVMTVSVWFKLGYSAAAYTDSVLGASAGNYGGGTIFRQGLASSAGRASLKARSVGVLPRDDQIEFRLDDAGVLLESGPVETGVWLHVVVTSDGSESRMYVNGSKVDTGPAYSAVGTDGQIDFGVDRTAGGLATEPWPKGYLWETVGLTQTLTDAEVSDLYRGY